MNEEEREELLKDFTEELQSVAKFKRITVINKELQKLGAEVGSIFVEFFSEKQS